MESDAPTTPADLDALPPEERIAALEALEAKLRRELDADEAPTQAE